jgi:hypothetical protein
MWVCGFVTLALRAKLHVGLPLKVSVVWSEQNLQLLTSFPSIHSHEDPFSLSPVI